VAGANEPGLQQRVVGSEREKRRPDRHREQAEQPDGEPADGRFTPTARDRQRQHHQAQDQHHQMDDDRHEPPARLHQEMSVGVAGQQQRLEEHHRHRPHRRRPAEARQHHPREQGLDREQQQRAGEYRRGENRENDGLTRNGRRRGRRNLID
jgi:hypothetical protein